MEWNLWNGWRERNPWKWPETPNPSPGVANARWEDGLELAPALPLQQMTGAQLFSEASLRRAWLAIKRAGGGAGVDGVTLDRFGAELEGELAELCAALAAGSYTPRPVKRVMVPKRSGGLRPLALWALRDRVAQRAVYDLLAPVFEPTFLPCSFGFRPGRKVEDAVGLVIEYRDKNLRWVVDADIEQCFDKINPRRLEGLIRSRVRHPLLLKYVGLWLRAGIFNSADGLPQQAGASQGSVLSPLFANIYLHELDKELIGRGLALVRYADDFVICCQRRVDAETALLHTGRALGKLALGLNETKSRIVHFDEGIEWLGYFFVRGEYYRLSR